MNQNAKSSTTTNSIGDLNTQIIIMQESSGLSSEDVMSDDDCNGVASGYSPVHDHQFVYQSGTARRWGKAIS